MGVFQLLQALRGQGVAKDSTPYGHLVNIRSYLHSHLKPVDSIPGWRMSFYGCEGGNLFNISTQYNLASTGKVRPHAFMPELHTPGWKKE